MLCVWIVYVEVQEKARLFYMGEPILVPFWECLASLFFCRRPAREALLGKKVQATYAKRTFSKNTGVPAVLWELLFPQLASI